MTTELVGAATEKMQSFCVNRDGNFSVPRHSVPSRLSELMNAAAIIEVALPVPQSYVRKIREIREVFLRTTCSRVSSVIYVKIKN